MEGGGDMRFFFHWSPQSIPPCPPPENGNIPWRTKKIFGYWRFDRPKVPSPPPPQTWNLVIQNFEFRFDHPPPTHTHTQTYPMRIPTQHREHRSFLICTRLSRFQPNGIFIDWIRHWKLTHDEYTMFTQSYLFGELTEVLPFNLASLLSQNEECHRTNMWKVAPLGV